MTKNGKEIVWGGLTAAVAAVAGAQGAFAADADMAPAHDWSGFYFGVSAGEQWGDAPLSFDNDYNMNGDIAFGGFAGVNHQFGNLVVGAELALQSGNGTDDGDGGSSDYAVLYTADSKLKLGMVMGAEDQVLIYGFGGFSATGINTQGGDNYSNFAANFGAGAEYMMTERISLGAEVMARAPIDEYGWSSHTHDAGLSYQASLRAAFHF